MPKISYRNFLRTLLVLLNLLFDFYLYILPDANAKERLVSNTIQTVFGSKRNSAPVEPATDDVLESVKNHSTYDELTKIKNNDENDGNSKTIDSLLPSYNYAKIQCMHFEFGVIAFLPLDSNDNRLTSKLSSEYKKMFLNKKFRPAGIDSLQYNQTTPTINMGNSQASNNINKSIEINSGIRTSDSGIKNRRESRIKILTRFGSTKTLLSILPSFQPPLALPQPVSSSSIPIVTKLDITPSIVIAHEEEESGGPKPTSASYDDSINELYPHLKQNFAANIRQMDVEHIDFQNVDDIGELRNNSEIHIIDCIKDYDLTLLRDFSSSSDSLFTYPISLNSPKQPFRKSYDLFSEVYDETNEHFCTSTLSTIGKITDLPIISKERPISEFSVTSGDTSGILSPTTAKAVTELQKHHRADKFKQLSISKTTLLEITADRSPELGSDNVDEQMAIQLSNKLTQIIKNNGGDSVYTSTIEQDSTPLVMGTNDIFNIAKAKKIELQNFSSRLTITPPQQQINSEGQPLILASTDAKNPSPITCENQSTVIISFKSSQTPAQSQQLSTRVASSSGTTSNNNSDEILSNTASNTVFAWVPTTSTEIPTSTLVSSINNNNITHLNSPNHHEFGITTSTSNVLKKVASFTVDKTSSGSLNCNGLCTPGIQPNMDNLGSRRSSYVPEKLSFAAYEKFEGQMLIKWLMSSVHSNINEQELTSLTIQYCNNLINIGVLKQISEKNEVENFSPFQMYQWTYTEAPTTSVPLTPGKLDKVNAWPYTSTPTGIIRVAKGIQVDSITVENAFQLTLRKRLLNCSTIEEVHMVVNNMLVVTESHRRTSKRCTQLSEVLNASESTTHEFQKKSSLANDTTINETKNDTILPASIPQQTDICYLCGQPYEKSNVSKSTQTDQFGENKIPKPIMLKPEEKNKMDENGCSAQSPNKLLKTNIPLPPPMPNFEVFIPNPPPLPAKVIIAGPPAPPPIPPPPPVSSSLLRVHEEATPTTPPGTARVTPVVTPAPLPNPTEANWFSHSTLRKSAVNPPKPMKPLYWTRIVTSPPPTVSVKPTSAVVEDNVEPNSLQDDQLHISTCAKEIWQEIDETNLDNIDEFTELFSRQAVLPTSKPKEKKEIRIKVMKVLDSKRSQNVGILSRSLHVDFYEIEHAIYHVDTSVVSLETLQHIINIKATNEELELIKEAAQGDIPLDHPEQFLLKIAQISMSTERISCIIFQAEFDEAATILSRKLSVVMQLSQFLIESQNLKLVFAIILTLGNYMNGGNRQRGQADGFTLEILGKLKDVKSKDTHTTLLHFIVRTYISRRRKEGILLPDIVFPIPEPSDVERAAQVDFDEVKIQIAELNKKLNTCKKTTEKVVLAATKETLQPFKNKIEEFIEGAIKTVQRLYKELDQCRDLFLDTMKFYHFTPKSRTLDQCTPDQFFEYWTNFTYDFKDIWKKEMAIHRDNLLKKTKQIQAQALRNVKATKIKPGGHKERMMLLCRK